MYLAWNFDSEVSIGAHEVRDRGWMLENTVDNWKLRVLKATVDSNRSPPDGGSALSQLILLTYFVLINLTNSILIAFSDIFLSNFDKDS